MAVESIALVSSSSKSSLILYRHRLRVQPSTVILPSNIGRRMDSHINELSYAAPALIALFTIPTAWRFVKNFKKPRSTHHEVLYEDKDGVATEESMAQYSTKLQFVIIFTSLVVGLLVSFGLAVFATVEKNQGFSDRCLAQLWLLFLSWARQGFDAIGPHAWIWVFGLLAATVAETMMDNRMMWLMWTDIAVPNVEDERLQRAPNSRIEGRRNRKGKGFPFKANGDVNSNGTANHASTAKKADDVGTNQKLETDKDMTNVSFLDAVRVANCGAVNPLYILVFCKFLVSTIS
ncbi:hypothetical protein DSL72_007534 [Monilinia vaccinii-corymbosi]|uniref:Uncharacterized protein n=1 Tax=Monilinia vaccinii-corymbosi TaxID=61207 RepID=A0A8A3PHX7_9HELO|nr:hypothetical protein DSL72_007534 [Monilinia vaccinii-corymbosi]